MFDVRVTFANVYFPNVDHSQFLRRLLPDFLEFAEGMLVFGGDLNWIRPLMRRLPPLLLMSEAPEGGSTHSAPSGPLAVAHSAGLGLHLFFPRCTTQNHG